MTSADRNGHTERVRVVPADGLDPDTARRFAMKRIAEVTHAPTGIRTLWSDVVEIPPDARTGAHHHGPLETVIYVLDGRARVRWGTQLESATGAGPGDFILVPAWLPHEEANASASEPLRCLFMLDEQPPVMVAVEAGGSAPTVRWLDPHHPGT